MFWGIFVATIPLPLSNNTPLLLTSLEQGGIVARNSTDVFKIFSFRKKNVRKNISHVEGTFPKIPKIVFRNARDKCKHLKNTLDEYLRTE